LAIKASPDAFSGKAFNAAVAAAISALLAAFLLAGCGKGSHPVHFAGAGQGREQGLSPASAASESAGGPQRQAPSEASLADVLFEIESFQPPRGADPAVVNALKDALKSALAERGATRFTSALSADVARVIHTAAIGRDGGAQILWEARLAGDADCDGQVNVSDITPIALRFGRLSNDGSDDGYDAQADTDGDGEVGLGDITPIALNYLARIDGYVIGRAASADGPFEAVGSAGFDGSWYSGGETYRLSFPGRPGVFVFTDADAGAGSHWYAIKPYSGPEEPQWGGEIPVEFRDEGLSGRSDYSPENIVRSEMPGGLP
jgi:hypothetical protein